MPLMSLHSKFIDAVSFVTMALSVVALSLRAVLIRGFGPWRQCEYSVHGSRVITGFRLARLIVCAALLLMLVAATLGHPERETTTSVSWCSMPLAIAYLYTSSLSAFSVRYGGPWSQVLNRHATLMLAPILVVFIFRDIWPLATYTSRPPDDGLIFWSNMVVLFIASTIIPLSEPRGNIPTDTKDSGYVVNPEEGASIFSVATYSFLNPFISAATRSDHASHISFPSLCQEDDLNWLRSWAIGFMGSHAERPNHRERPRLVWTCFKLFRWEFCAMSICIIGQTLSSFAAPVSINRLVAYLEVDSSPSTIRPWFWVLLLFIGPMGVSLLSEQYAFIAGKVSVRVRAILTHLIYEHSLKMRINASSHAAEQSPDPSQNATTPTSYDPGAPATSTSTNLVGRLNTLVTVDMDNIVGAKEFLMCFLQTPLELALAIGFLYVVLGWSAFVGLGCILVFSSIPGYIAGRMQFISKRRLEKTDARVEAVTEVIGVLRMIKMFGWVKQTEERLDIIREEELKWLFRDKVATLFNNVVNYCIPIITMIATFGSHTLIAKEQLTPSKLFSSMAVMEIVRVLLHRTSWVIGCLMRAKVSFDRVESVLHETELLDIFIQDSVTDFTGHGDEIGFQDAVFHWLDPPTNAVSESSSTSFRLCVNGRLVFKSKALNLVVGPTGCGKTSLLMALLGEMRFVGAKPGAWFNTPRNGGIAYAAQESWIQNATIRENILFGHPFDEDRYRKVLFQCCLEKDLENFPAGDRSEVGEQGITLSGGQKARLTLARAVYSDAQIVLLDDVLSALDVHTAAHITKECLQGDILASKTIILVTHNVPIVAPISQYIVTIDASGTVHELLVDDVERVLEEDKQPPAHANLDIKDEKDETKAFDVDDSHGTLIRSEENEVGHVSWPSLQLFLSTLGGNHPMSFFVTWLLGVALMHTSATSGLWYLGRFGTQFEKGDPSQVDVVHYLGIYAAILLCGVAIYSGAATTFHRGSQRASRSIYRQLMDSVLSSTFRWMDQTPTSRIFARCTQDIRTVDIAFAWAVYQIVELLLFMILKLGGPTIFTPIFIIPASISLLAGWQIGARYLKAQLPVKRELGKASAPILAHLNATLSGLVSIRAYGAQESFKQTSIDRINHLSRLSRTSVNLNAWIAIRSDFLAAALPALLAGYLITRKNVAAANTGFSLASSVEFCGGILWLVRSWNDLEVISNSLERIGAYLHIDHESKEAKISPPAAWPKNGDLDIRNLSARYTEDGRKILHDLTFRVDSGQRIGIVGRTGAGKSTLTLSLLRCILTEGEIIYDGVKISDLDLDKLRSSISIIPQLPELLSGTLRRNLDPFEKHDDMTLNRALQDAGLSSLRMHSVSDSSSNAALTLDSKISSGGKNLSVGQRQIIALARALVRDSKVLILDEATSSIDHETDRAIQQALRKNASAGLTVLTVAHRLKTVMDVDKVMVLDQGRIVEFDSPETLLRGGGPFKKMVDASDDKDILYTLALEAKTGRG